MSIGAVLVGGALLALSGAYVARPFFEGLARTAGPPANPRAQLTARRDAIYALIRELDADHREGKLNDEDYAAQRELYVAEGVAVLKQLDNLPQDDGRAALDARIEAAVLALRRARAPAGEAQKEPAERFCTQCGHKAAPEHSFCAHCGAQLPR